MSNTQLDTLLTFLPKDPDLTQNFKQRYHETKIISVSDQIKALQWSLRAWMAQRIVLLILTGVIGYTLYYYFTHRPSEARHIFTALSKVNRTILILPCHISEEDESYDIISEEKSTQPVHESSESSVQTSPSPANADEPLERKPIQSLINYPPQRLFDALEKTSATTYELWWNEDKKLIDDTLDHWRQHTPPSQVSMLLEEITQPMKKIYQLLALRYHPDKMQHDSTDQEKAIFQQMKDYILGVGERLNSITNQRGLAFPSQGNTYTDIMRDFLNLRKESKQQLATLAQLSRNNQRMQKELTELSQSTAELRKQSDLQNQHLVAICHENERQKKQLADIGQSFAQARRDLADIEKQLEQNKKKTQSRQHHQEQLARWQEKLNEDEQNIVTMRHICIHAACLNTNHPLVNTYFPQFFARRHEDTSIDSTDFLLLCLIGIHYFIRTGEPECAQKLYHHIVHFDHKEDVQSYQSLLEQAQQKMKPLEPIIQEECNIPTPM